MKRCLYLIIAVSLALPLLAQDGAAPRAPARSTASDRQPAFTPEREAAALSFVKQHHSELGELLTQLKANNRPEYRRAINELFLASERLAAYKDRDPLKYELDLRAWKIDSRVRLLAARLAMTENDLLQAELKELLLEKVDIQLEQQLLDRQRLAARLERLDATIDRLRNQRQDEAQKALAKVMQEVQKSRPAKKPARASSNQAGSNQTDVKVNK
jgi:hypothetical protein